MSQLIVVEIVYTVKGEIGPSRSRLEVPVSESSEKIKQVLNEKLAPKRVDKVVSIVQVK